MSHTHSDEPQDNTFTLGLVLNSGFTALEFVAGALTGSLALIADATHNLTDSLTLLISLIAKKIGARSATDSKTYGYGRATIIAALLNAGILVAVALYIGIEAILRFSNPREIDGVWVVAVASVGIVINGFIAWRLSKQKHDLNARSAYTNMLYDTLSSVGAVVAGLVIIFTGWNWLDAVVGIVIAVMLLSATIKIVKEALGVLLEGVPEGISVAKLTASINAVTLVEAVDDLHVWSIRSGYNALSCHIVIDETKLQESRQIIEAVKEMLKTQHDIQHATIEVELEDCTKHEDHEQH